MDLLFCKFSKEVRDFTNFSEEKTSFEKGGIVGANFIQHASDSKTLITTKMTVI